MLGSLKRVVYRGHSPYYYARKSLFNLQHRGEHLRRKKIARGYDGSLNGSLNREGWCDIKLDPHSTAEAVAACCLIDQQKDPDNIEPPAGAGKDFWKFLVDSDSIQQHPELIRFAGQQRLREIASAYIGEEAILMNITLMKSYPTGRQIKHSQLWHLDGADDRQLLFYLYCSDVDNQSGPFALIEKSQMKPDWRPRFLRKYGYSDAEISGLAKDGAAVRSITGPAGTMFACDTARTYHQGSRCESKTRLALAIRYTTFSGLAPVNEILYEP